MKALLIKILQGSLLLGLLWGCVKEEVPVYETHNNGIYFQLGGQAKKGFSINFANVILNRPTEVPLQLRLKVLGTNSGVPRKVLLSTKPLDEYGEAEVVVPEIIFLPDTLEKTVTVMVQRPTTRDAVFATVLFIDTEHSESNFGATIEGANEVKIFVEESYSKPKGWDGLAQAYMGEWSAEKQIFFVDLSKNNKFYTSNDYSQFLNWNVLGVDSVRLMQQSGTATEELIAVPFVNDNASAYKKPWYWGELQSEYLGNYNGSVFVSLANALKVDSSNEHTLFNVSEEELMALNKKAVPLMMQAYNRYYSDGWRLGESYKSNFFVPMLEGVEYELVQPRHWADIPGGGELIKKYYGDYSAEKYQFMIEVFMQHRGELFVLNHLFPVLNEWGNVRWDNSIGGENAIKQYNKLFREKVAEAGGKNFTFPIVE